MTRYILIDSYTGYIFGDTADYAGGRAMTPIEAARELDETVVGEHGRTYAMHRRNGTEQSGYDVYRADIDGSEAVPVVYDGQDQETINAVVRDCEYVGFVAYHTAA